MMKKLHNKYEEEFENSLSAVVKENNEINSIIIQFLKNKDKNRKILSKIQEIVIKESRAEDSFTTNNLVDEKKLMSFFITIENQKNMSKYIKQIRKQKKKKITYSAFVNDAVKFYHKALTSSNEDLL